MTKEELREQIIEHLKTYDVRPDMIRPLADVLEANGIAREKAAVERALLMLKKKQPAGTAPNMFSAGYFDAVAEMTDIYYDLFPS